MSTYHTFCEIAGKKHSFFWLSFRDDLSGLWVSCLLLLGCFLSWKCRRNPASRQGCWSLESQNAKCSSELIQCDHIDWPSHL